MKLWDGICDHCGDQYEDIWDYQIGMVCRACRRGHVQKLFRSAPTIDFRAPFEVKSLGGGTFTSNREAERYAARTGQELLTDTQRETRLSSAKAAIKQQRDAEKREVIAKTHYRLKHGYRDFPKLDKEV